MLTPYGKRKLTAIFLPWKEIRRLKRIVEDIRWALIQEQTKLEAMQESKDSFHKLATDYKNRIQTCEAENEVLTHSLNFAKNLNKTLLVNAKQETARLKKFQSNYEKFKNFIPSQQKTPYPWPNPRARAALGKSEKTS